MKRKSILNKIRKQVLIGSVSAALCMCAVAVVCILIMRGNIMNTSEKLGVSAAQDSESALETQMQNSLQLLAQNKAAMSDEKLSATAGLVRVIAENTTAILSDPSRHLPYIPAFPDPANAGKIVPQLRLPDGVSLSSVADEAGLLGNISDLLVSQLGSLDFVGGDYIGTEQGVSISADGDSDKKTDIYDPRTRGWYAAAKDANALIWTDVFADSSGRGLSISCAAPFYGADGSFQGVA